MTDEEYKKEFSKHGLTYLQKLWNNLCNKSNLPKGWDKGKAFEYLIMRCFELEVKELKKDSTRADAYVSYPYNVEYPYTGEDCSAILEQIDGAINVDGYYCLIECKKYDAIPIKVEPLTKMRNILARRHSNVFGMFFSMTDLTTPAKIQVQFMAPQLILLWSKDDIDYCLNHGCFIDCMKWKYRNAVEKCEYFLSYKQYMQKESPVCEAMF